MYLKTSRGLRAEDTPILPTPSKPAPTPKLQAVTDDDLLAYGVPSEWIPTLREVIDDDGLLSVAEHLPQEAAQAVLELATGGKPKRTEPIAPTADPLSHPDAKRRFHLVRSIELLKAALEYPWDKWTTFLHPDQQDIVEREYSGPGRVSGSAGTGKTIVALHRAVHLAKKNDNYRVLLTTFSPALANALKDRLRKLIASKPALGERIEVAAITDIGLRLYKKRNGQVQIASDQDLREIFREALKTKSQVKFSLSFLLNEWQEVVDAEQIKTWDGYRDVRRIGRKTRLSAVLREVIWDYYKDIDAELSKRGKTTYATVFQTLADAMRTEANLPYDAIVVDEAQDITQTQLRFLASLNRSSNSLFFAGDLGQRIFQTPFSWKSTGVDIRGRSKTLKVNYRTSQQIRQRADQLLEEDLRDVDGNVESRSGTVSLFNGVEPEFALCGTLEAERIRVSKWLTDQLSAGVAANSCCLIVRSAAEVERAVAIVRNAGAAATILDSEALVPSGHVAVATMPLVKGLEFRSVAVIACDSGIIPSDDRLEAVTDEADLEEIYATERQLLYVAVTRARDTLLISCGGEPSEFVEDLRPRGAS
jgi:superfamily I DNA/RNA helicase